MSTNFPTSLDTLTNPSATDPISNPSHSAQHANINDAVEALQSKLGIDSSAVVTSIDYLLKNTSSTDPGHKHTLANSATDVTATASELNLLDLSGLTTGHVLKATGASSASWGQLSTSELNNDAGFLTSALQNVVEDTSPQLGGELDAQSNNIIDLGDVTFKTGASGGTLRTGTSGADKFVLQAYDVDGGSYLTMLELDAGNTPLMKLLHVSQVDMDNGSYIHAGQTAGDSFTISAYDVDGASFTDFITLTSNNTPTCNLAGAVTHGGNTIVTSAYTGALADGVTATTQSANDNSTKVATTAYVDSAVAGAGGLSNVVEDTTPQLGGNLDMNGNSITSPDGTDTLAIVNGTLTIQTASSTRLDITDSGLQLGGSGARVTTILDEDTMSSDSATALATQQSIKAYIDTQVASAGGGAPKVIEHHLFNDITLYDTATSGSGSVTATAGPFVRLYKHSTSGSDAKIVSKVCSTGSVPDGYWDMNPSFSGYIRMQNVDGTWHAWLLNASMNSSNEPADGGTYTTQHMGYTIDVDSSVLTTIYATNANGSSQTQTDIKTGITTSFNNLYTCVADSGTNVKFYVNGTLKATHTTNLPSGDLGNFRFSAGIDDDGGGFTTQFDVSRVTLSWDAY